MATLVDLTPDNWVASWSEDGTNVTFPIASLPELTAAEADVATGDIRKVLFALLEELQAKWDTFAADPNTYIMPSYMTLSKGATFNAATNRVNLNYVVSLEMDISGLEVRAES